MDATTRHGGGCCEPPLVGRSARWLETVALARKVARLEVPVLVTGPSGSGKELIARAIHRWSRRAAGPLVPLNCGALHEGLVESELFGHRKGAFTGAVADRDGLCRVAAGGTLCLDEVGELPAACQAKLLRFLESGEYRPLGGRELRNSDARVIAVTHRNLERMIAEGSFRQDLFYRLNVLRVEVPALRERAEDIPLLVDRFLAAGARRCRLSSGALKRLQQHPWPGNVRELRNLLERLQVHCDGDVIGHALVEQLLEQQAPGPAALPRPRFEALLPLERVVDDYVAWALQRCQGNISTTARSLGISRSKVYRILERNGGA